MNFKQLGVSDAMLRAIQREGIETPTEIQSKSIPHVIKGKDVIAGAATGSGKTLAFGSAIVKECKKGQGVQALVLTPTRELAIQVAQALKKFSKYTDLSIISIYGGVSINPQISSLRKADVVVGTPGRVLDHLRRRTMKLQFLKILVIDEADRMLDMGFIQDVETIIRHCPKKRQTLLFSATISDDISRLARRYMKDQVKISAESFVDPTKLKQFYYDVPRNKKLSLLVHMLRHEHAGMAMVFCNTRRNVDFVTKNLKGAGVRAIAIHGGYSQAKRTRTMDTFKDQRINVLVCTDVAARGLHIDGVTHIYNYDTPKEPKQYIHRIGRTARAGEEGKAVTLLSDYDYENFSRVLDRFSVHVVKMNLPKIERVEVRTQERHAKGYGRSGNRQSYRRY